MKPDAHSVTAVGRMDRRTAIKWLLTAAASAALADHGALAADADRPPATGYGLDPDLLRDYKPGDLWPLTFDEHQRFTAAALCEVIIPEDPRSPSAAALGVHHFIDEWISAPYPAFSNDRKSILEGLAWLDRESRRRFRRDFTDLVVQQKIALCEDICLVKSAKPEFREAAQFFKRYRDLTAGGFYTTPEGMKDIGYTGNVPLAAFDGPPPEVLKKLGLT